MSQPPWPQPGRWYRLARQTGEDRNGQYAGRNFLSLGTGTKGGRKIFLVAKTYLAFGTLAGLDAIATFNHIGLQAYRARPPVQLQKQSAGVAKNGAQLVAAPQGSGRGTTVLADGL